MPLFMAGEKRVGTTEEEDRNVPVLLQLPPAELFQLPPAGAIETGCDLVSSGDFDQAQPCHQGPESLQEFGLEMRGIEQGHEATGPLAILIKGCGDGGAELGIVTASQRSRAAQCRTVGANPERERQKDGLGPLRQETDMAVQGGDGGAELGPGQALTALQNIPAVFAGHGPDPQLCEEALPEGQLLEQVQGGRQPDGDSRPGVEPPACRKARW